MRTKDHQTITHSAAHYLTKIDELIKDGGYARLTDIYKGLNISAGSCLTTLKKLKTRGLIEEDSNKFYTLSHEGKALANLITKNEKLIHSFLTKILGVSKARATLESCKLEHLLSTETCSKLARFMKLMLSEDKDVLKFKLRLEKEPAICWKTFDL